MEPTCDLFELIRRAQSGDRTALDDRFSRCIERLRMWLEPQIERSLRSKLDASDVVQSALAEALQSLDSYTYRGPRSFDNWLRRVVKRRLFHKRAHFATQGRDHHREVSLDPNLEDTAVSGAISPPATWAGSLRPEAGRPTDPTPAGRR